MNVKIPLVILVIITGIGIISGGNLLHFVYSDKNPQAECINGQNDGFIGKEQKGDAYKSSKDTCQTLSK